MIQAKKIVYLLLAFMISYQLNGMKTFQEKEPRQSPPPKIPKIEPVSSPAPKAISSGQQAFISKIEEQIYTETDPSVMIDLLSQPEASLLSNETRDSLYVQAKAFQQLLMPNDENYPRMIIKTNYLSAFRFFPQFTFPSLFFSPTPYKRLSDKRPYLKEILTMLIENEQEKIYVCCYHITLASIGEALLEQKKKGIPIEIITNHSQGNTQDSWFTLTTLKNNGIPVLFPRNDEYEQMHHKFFIFKKNIFNKSLIMIGSYNPTRHSDMHSWDDIIVLDDQNIINQYIERFEEIRRRCTR